MKTYSIVLLAVYFIIEILAIILYVSKEINAKVFFLIVIAMSSMIGLVFLYWHKKKNK